MKPACSMPCLPELRRIRFLLERMAPPPMMPFAADADGRMAVRIRDFIAKHFDLSPEQMCQSRQFQAIAWPRAVSMALCRKLTNLSLQQVAELHNERDHSTTRYAIKTVKNRCDTEPATRKLVEELEAELTKNHDKSNPNPRPVPA